MHQDTRPTAVHLEQRRMDKANPRTKTSRAMFQSAMKRLGPDKDGAFRVANRLDGKQ